MELIFYMSIGCLALLFGMGNLDRFMRSIRNESRTETRVTKWVFCTIDLLMAVLSFTSMCIMFWAILTVCYEVSMDFWNWSDMYPSSLPAFNQYELMEMNNEPTG